MNPTATTDSTIGYSTRKYWSLAPLCLLWRTLRHWLLRPARACKGRLLISGETVSTEIVLQRKGIGSLILRPRVESTDKWSRTRLNVTSFFPLLDSCLAQPGVEVRVGESALGAERSFWEEGPLGHPGDGEYRVRPLKSLSIQVSRRPSGLVIAMRGETTEGYEVALEKVHRSHPRPPAWSFEADVHISDAELRYLGAEGAACM